MAEPYTIRIFVQSGDPEGVKIVDRLNWTGKGIALPRSSWTELRERAEFEKPGIYILTGSSEGSDVDLPTVYVGQADGVRDRVDSHDLNKDFWDWAYIFVSSNDALNRAHITWLEHALIQRAQKANRCRLDNVISPREPALSEAEKADTSAFLKEMLRILPLLGVRAFDQPRPVVQVPTIDVVSAPQIAADDRDTVIVPAQEEGFQDVFLRQNMWYAIRISGGMLPKIKYIAAYQTAPVSAITHYAPVSVIEPYGDEGKYKLVFAEPAKTLGPIQFADAPKGSMQGPRYANLQRLRAAKKFADIFPKDNPPASDAGRPSSDVNLRRT